MAEDRTDDFYPAEGAIAGFGAQMQVGDGTSPEQFESVAGVKEITPGESSTRNMDRSHHRSPEYHDESMPGRRQSGAFAVRGLYLPEEWSLSNEGGGTGAFQNGGIPAMYRARTIHNFRVKLSNGSFIPFRGYVSKFQVGTISMDDPIEYTAEFMPTEAFDQNYN